MMLKKAGWGVVVAVWGLVGCAAGEPEPFDAQTAPATACDECAVEQPDFPEPASDLEGASSFAEACQTIADAAAACIAGDDTLQACAPAGDGQALACCNALDEPHCEATCSAGAAPLSADLSFIHELYADGGLTDVDAWVAPLCDGSDFGDVIAAARQGSDLLEAHGLTMWPEGTVMQADEIQGMFTFGTEALFDGLAPIAGDTEVVGWNARVEISDGEGLVFVDKWVLFYPATGLAVELEGSYGWL